MSLNLSVIIKLRSRAGPDCSKLTTSLVNISLEFQMLISENCRIFLLIKLYKLLHFSMKISMSSIINS